MVKASAVSKAAEPRFDFLFILGDFSGSSHTSDIKKKKIVTTVATLPGEWRYRVSVGTGWPVVNVL